MSRRQRAAGNVVLCSDEEPILTEVDEVQSKIRQRAFEISLSRNHAGREVEDWLAAESEVIVSPPVELAQKNGEFIVRMAAPGIDPNNLTILATRDQLLVKSIFRHDHEPDAEIHACEFKSTMIFRSVRFPEPVELRSLKTELADGFLKITAQRESQTGRSQELPARKTQAATKSRKKKG